MLNRELKLVFPRLYGIVVEETHRQQQSFSDSNKINGSFTWFDSSQGYGFWADIWDSNFENWKECATLPYLKKYKPEIYGMAVQERMRQYGCSRERAEEFENALAGYFSFESSFKGYDFWRKVADMNEGAIKKQTIGARLNKNFPFIVRDSNGRLLYREDHKENWYRRRYDKQGKLILIKNNKGKLWRTTVTTG